MNEMTPHQLSEVSGAGVVGELFRWLGSTSCSGGGDGSDIGTYASSNYVAA